MIRIFECAAFLGYAAYLACGVREARRSGWEFLLPLLSVPLFALLSAGLTPGVAFGHAVVFIGATLLTLVVGYRGRPILVMRKLVEADPEDRRALGIDAERASFLDTWFALILAAYVTTFWSSGE